MKRILALCLLSLVACDPNIPDTTFQPDVAGSPAIEALTQSFNVVNSNGGADITAQNDLNLLRFWVMQYTNTSHYQPTEWSCSSLFVNACSSNFGLPNWALGTCTPQPGGSRKCRLLKQGTDVGWASLVPQGTSWYSQFNADNRSANGQLNPIRLTVVK
jgi:hypothetical protein